jgi:hypothetical protein
MLTARFHSYPLALRTTSSIYFITMAILDIIHLFKTQRFGYWILSQSSGGTHLKKETESSLRNVVFQIKGRTMDNVQNCDSYINTPSSQIRSCFGVLCLVVLTKYNRRLCVNNFPIHVLFYNANTVDSHECP